jgi:hypothetical protein
VTFARRSWTLGFAVAAVAVTAISAAIYPHVATGPHDGLAPRVQALFATGLVVLGAFGALLAARRSA